MRTTIVKPWDIGGRSFLYVNWKFKVVPNCVDLGNLEFCQGHGRSFQRQVQRCRNTRTFKREKSLNFDMALKTGTEIQVIGTIKQKRCD